MLVSQLRSWYTCKGFRYLKPKPQTWVLRVIGRTLNKTLSQQIERQIERQLTLISTGSMFGV